MQNTFNTLHQFIANNYNLEELEAILNVFNPLKVLKVDKYEIRHSNIISWLLSPNENHNMGSTFLKKFLAEAIINNENLETSLTVFNIQEMAYQDFEVKREWNDIDMFIVSHSNKLAILIENKVHANESKGQLEKYYNLVKNKYIDYQIIPIFLTLEGTLPSHNSYGVVSYVQILHILKFITTIQKENISNKVHDFINYYLRTLEILTMDDQNIKTLCKKLYKDHKEALDLIYKYAEDTEFEESAKDYFLTIGAQKIKIDGISAWFIPHDFHDNYKIISEELWCSGFPFAFWFIANKKKDTLGFIIEIGPMGSDSHRQNFLNHLKEYEFKIKNISLKPGAKYTRIFSKYKEFKNWDSKESIIQKMDELYSANSSKKIEGNLLKACKSFEW